jgi:hypothetical protein
MKKIFFIVGLLLATGCGKKECNCGVITNDEITQDANGNNCYTLSIRNSCSNNVKTWCFDYNIWVDNPVGENFCVTNETSW